MKGQLDRKDILALGVVSLTGGSLGILFFCLQALELLSFTEGKSLVPLVRDLGQLALFGLMAFVFLVGGGREVLRRSSSSAYPTALEHQAGNCSLSAHCPPEWQCKVI